MNDIPEDIESVEYKMIFFFMPETIVFNKAQKGDDIDLVTLKSISPYFYWCSAQEFTDFEPKYRYLFQYQMYTVEGSKIVPGEIFQKWRKNKNNIREDLMQFIEEWSDHKRLLTSPENKKENSNENFYNKTYNFKDFAKFVAKSIISLQDLYIKQASIINFDLLQKEYWKMVAMNKNEIYNTVPDFKIKKTLPNKKRKLKKDTVKRKKPLK
jgi:hypothetical protein